MLVDRAGPFRMAMGVDVVLAVRTAVLGYYVGRWVVGYFGTGGGWGSGDGVGGGGGRGRMLPITDVGDEFYVL